MHHTSFRQFVSIILTTLIINQPLLLAGGITVDPVNPQVGLDKAQNGVPVLNIAAPNAQGLSHNRLTDLNVDKPGLILNNSNQFGVSQLGGALYNNPNLPNGATPASLILNEVTGVNRTNLNGFTEIFGRKADYVVANPNGISCSGCGFINTDRTTLTTGRPEFENGFLKNLNVQGGDVTIYGDGLNAENINYFEIISRTASLQGQINAKDLSIITGTNNYDYQNKQVTSQNAVAGAKPDISIDATSLGSVYANRIKMISTEAGVGVRVLNDMVTNASDVSIDAKGNITYNNLTSSGNIALTSTDKITGTGTAGATGSFIANSNETEIQAGAKVISNTDTSITSNNITNAGSIQAANNLNTNGTILNNSGEMLSENNIQITATGDVTNSGSISSNTQANINSSTLSNSGNILSNTVTLNPTNSFNNSGSVSGGTFTLSSQTVNNTGSLISDSMTLNSSTLSNSASIQSKDMTINSSFLTNTGTILGINTAHINSTINNSSNSSIEGNSLWLNGKITNTGKINGYTLLNINTGSIDNTNGEISAGVLDKDTTTGLYTSVLNTGTLELIHSGDLTINGKYFSTGKMSFTANNIINNSVDTKALNQLDIITPGTFTNNSGKILMAGVHSHPDFSSDYNNGILNIHASQVVNNSGSILYATKELNITPTDSDAPNPISVSSIYNNGMIFSWDKMTLTATNRIYNDQYANIYSYGDMTLSTDMSSGQVINNMGTIATAEPDSVLTGGNLTINTSYLLNNSIVGSAPAGSYSIINKTNNNGTIYDMEKDGETDLHNDMNQACRDRWGYDCYVQWGYGPNTPILILGAFPKELGHQEIQYSDPNKLYNVLPVLSHSTISAGKTLTINANTIDNVNSDLLANGDINITATTINNKTSYQEIPLYIVYVTQNVDATHGSWRGHINSFMFFNTPRDFANLVSGNLDAGLIYKLDLASDEDYFNVGTYRELLYNFSYTKQNLPSAYLYSDHHASIIAGGDFHFKNPLTGANPLSNSAASQSLSGTTPGLNNYAPPSTGTFSIGTDKTGQQNKQDPAFRVDGIFFNYSKGNTYVIESNPMFTDVTRLVTSDYFLQRLGYSRDQFSTLFMGDAYWEKEYIAKQVQQKLSRRFIADDVDSDAKQREVLFSNAEEVAGDLKLAVGIALTDDQIKALKKPIVWYVEEDQVINGKKEKVLVPHVYVPANYEMEIGAGGVLSAKNLDIDIKGDVKTSGLFYAQQNASVKSDNFSASRANIVTGKVGNLNITTTGNIDIYGSRLNVGNNASLNATGDINIGAWNESSRDIVRNADGSTTVSQTDLLLSSDIFAGNNFSSHSRNFTMIASNIVAVNNAAIEAEIDAVISSGTEKYCATTEKYENSGFLSDRHVVDTLETTNQKGSSISAGSGLNIKTGRDLTFISSTASGDNISLDAGRDINFLSAANEESKTHSEIKSSVLTTETTETTNYKATHQGSFIKGGSSVSAKAGGDINMVSSNVTANQDSGTVSMDATNVNVMAAKDIDQSSSYHKKETFSIWGVFKGIASFSFLRGGDINVASFKEGTKVSKTETASASNISGANVNIKTKNDLNIAGSNIAATNNTNLDVGHDLNVFSVEQVATADSSEKEGKVFINAKVSGISSVAVQAGVKYTETTESSKNVNNATSSITGKNVTIKTGNDLTSQGATIGATENIDITTGGKLKVLAVHDTAESSSSKSEVKTGIELRLSANALSFGEGWYGIGKSVATGGLFKGIKSAGSGIGNIVTGKSILKGNEDNINNAFSTFNSTMDNIAKINKASGGLDGYSSNLNYFFEVSKSETSFSSSTVRGSNITAGNKITANVGSDMLLHGSNMSAKEIDANVKGNLDIKSEYDTTTSASTSVTLGGTVGLTDGKVNMYGNGTFSGSDKAWVNNQAGMNSTGKMNVKVGGNTNIEGGIINSDSGEMNLDTQSLTYKDMKGHDTSYTYGGGRSTDLDLNKSSTNIQYGNKDKEQVAHATVGAGNITVGGKKVEDSGTELKGLNRDVKKSVEITKNEETKLINVSIDDRLLSSAGRKQIASDFVTAFHVTQSVANKIVDTTAKLFESTQTIKDPVAKQKAEKGVEYYQKVMIQKILESKKRNGDDLDVNEITASLSKPEVQAGLQAFANFDPNKSMKENAQMLASFTVVDPVTGETKTIENPTLIKMLKEDRDDYALSKAVDVALYQAVAKFNNNPTLLISDTFGLTINKPEMVNPTLVGDIRNDAGGNGSYKSSRISLDKGTYPHDGTDITSPVGETLVAPIDGKVTKINGTTKGVDGNNSVYVEITGTPEQNADNNNSSNTLKTRVFYLNNDSLRVDTGSKVDAGDILGELTDVNGLYLQKRANEYDLLKPEVKKNYQNAQDYVQQTYKDVSPHTHENTQEITVENNKVNGVKAVNTNDYLNLPVPNNKKYQYLETGTTKEQFINNMKASK